MTYSILARDRETGLIGGAATTGSLCVGGWVLRADPRAGASASQGAAPSTFWGEAVLARMAEGRTARQAVDEVTGADRGRAARQLAAIDLQGGTGSYTGPGNTSAKGARALPDAVVTGNLLRSEAVLDAVADGYASAEGAFADRLLAALTAGRAEGGDSRGLLSAALLIVGPSAPPFTLRIDYSDTPLADLERLLARARDADYQSWLGTVPVLDDPERG